MKEFGQKLGAGEEADVLDSTAQKVGRNGYTYTRQSEVVQFDRQVRNYLIEHPKATRKQVALDLEVPVSRAINSVARLQNLGLVPVARHKFADKEGKRAERRNKIKEKVESYVNVVGKDAKFKKSEVVSYLKEGGIDTSRDLVGKIFNDLGVNKMPQEMGIDLDEVDNLKKEEKVDPIQPKTIEQPIEAISQDEDYENKTLEDVLSPQQILPVRDRFIRDLLRNNTPMAEVRYYTRTSDHELRETITRLREKGELPTPHI